MKRTTRITALLLALMTVLMMSQAAFAEDKNADGGTYTFNGTSIVQNGGDLADAIDGLMPGDTVTIEFVYKNDTDDSTEWYMRNEVLQTLEDTVADAKNGGYTYQLTNYGASTGTTYIFDSTAVAGDEQYEPGGVAKGLKGATDATDEFFHIDTLKKGQSGKTVLTVGLDGESQGNSYENAVAEIEVQYAVELTGQENKVVYKHVKTGDDTNILLPAAVMLAGLLLLILAFMNRRRDRKDGEDA